MIIVKMMGGLGNQMFQYAAAKSIAVVRDEDIQVDLSSYKTTQKRRYELFDYGIELQRIDDNKTIYQLKKENMKRYRKKKYFGIDPFHKLGIEVIPNIYQNILGAEYLDGYWQNILYFGSIRDLLVNEFKLQDSCLNKKEKNEFIKWEEKLAGLESVALHIRRGDYIEKNAENIYCNLSKNGYYYKAISMIQKRIINPVIFVFSDDIEWCKQSNIFHGIKQIFYVESTIESSVVNMELMRRCKHYVIANSTFSWWASYLGHDRKESMITAPSKWFVNSDRNNRIKSALYYEGIIEI